MANPTPSSDAATNPVLSIPGVPKPGELLAAKYRVERVIGRRRHGGRRRGDARRARRAGRGEVLLPQAAVGQPDAVARFVREAKAAIKIRSEHVVRVLDSGKLESGAPYIVMEYLEGRDLARRCSRRSGPLPVADARSTTSSRRATRSPRRTRSGSSTAT